MYTPLRQCQTEKHIYADMAKLFLQDLANVEAGIYPLPADHDGSPLALIHRSPIFFNDLPNIHRRREGPAHNEVLSETTHGTRPRYYLQNFHYQSGGWLTEKSAELYDTQVETSAWPIIKGDRVLRGSRGKATPIQLHYVLDTYR